MSWKKIPYDVIQKGKNVSKEDTWDFWTFKIIFFCFKQILSDQKLYKLLKSLFPFLNDDIKNLIHYNIAFVYFLIENLHNKFSFDELIKNCVIFNNFNEGHVMNNK